MRKVTIIFSILLLVLVLAGCGGESGSETGGETGEGGGGGLDNSQVGDSTEDGATAGDTSSSPGAGGFDSWLQSVGSGELPKISNEGSFEYGLGYLLYYGSLDSIGLDNLIYNALLVHRQLATGEVSSENLSKSQQNLLELTEGIEFNPDIDPTEQVGQTPEIREAILERISQSQSGLSPDEALNSNEVSGVVAIPSPEDIGSKYLVYVQDTPDAAFEFVGVVVAADGVAEESVSNEPYSFQGWSDLPVLGDAAGPFWNELPAGVSGDPSNTAEGRPGVLLVHEKMYEELSQGS